MEPFTEIVGTEVDRITADSLPVERQRDWPAVGEKGGATKVFHRLFADLYAYRILGVQQRIEMPTGCVGLTVTGMET